MSNTSISVVFVTSHFDLHCELSIRSGRALDAFNDTTTKFMNVENVRFHQHTQQEPVLTVKSSVVVKDNVFLALLLDEDRPSERKVFFAVQEKRSMRAVMTLPTVIVEGSLHMKISNDAPSFLSLESGVFFPVTDATVHGSDRFDPSTTYPVVMVKAAAISSLSLQRKES